MQLNSRAHAFGVGSTSKNLREKDSSLKIRYMDTRIDNFVSSKYENGCLLGYVLEANVDKTADGANEQTLKKDKREPEALKSKAF